MTGKKTPKAAAGKTGGLGDEPAKYERLDPCKNCIHDKKYHKNGRRRCSFMIHVTYQDVPKQCACIRFEGAFKEYP